MGQNPNKSKSTYIADCSEYINMMTDNDLEINGVLHVNDEHVALMWREKSEFIQSLPHTNVVLTAFTTAHARLKLYSLLEKLQDRVLYFDIDCVVYIHNEDLWNPHLGDYLGELKDETNGVPILTFVSGGAKNYAYNLEDGTSVCKISGFTVNHRNSLTLNMNTLIDLVTVEGTAHKHVVTNPFKIVRKDGTLFTKSESKNLSACLQQTLLCWRFENTSLWVETIAT